MARTRSRNASSKRKSSHPRSLSGQLSSKKGEKGTSTWSASPSFSITPFIFMFLGNIDLQLVGLSIGSLRHLLPFVNMTGPLLNESQRVTGKEMVMYDSVVAE